MTRAMLLALLAGCQLVTSGGASGPTTPTTPMAPTGGAAPTGPTGASEPSAPPSGDGWVVAPNVIGMTEDQARAAFKAAGFSSDLEDNHPNECEHPPETPNRVNCQQPEAGGRVRSYTLPMVNVYVAPTHEGRITREDMEALIGMTTDAAVAKLHQLGYKGDCRITNGTSYYKGCAEGHVCDIEQHGDDSCVVYVNKKLELSAPPP